MMDRAGRLVLIFCVGGTAFVMPVTRCGMVTLHSQTQESGFEDVLHGVHDFGATVRDIPGRVVDVFDAIPISVFERITWISVAGTGLLGTNLLLGLNLLPFVSQELQRDIFSVLVVAAVTGVAGNIVSFFRGSTKRKLWDAFERYDEISTLSEIFGPTSHVDDVVRYQADAPETEVLVLTGDGLPPNGATPKVFDALLRGPKNILVMPMTGTSLADEIKKVTNFRDDVAVGKIGKILKERNVPGPFAVKRVDIVVQARPYWSNDDVTKVLDEAEILKESGGPRLGVIICVPDAAQLPEQLPPTVPARLSQATLQARAAEEAKRAAERKLVNDAADANNETAFFFALNDRAVSRGLSDAKLNDLAVVKERLIAKNRRAIAKTREILAKYNTSSKDDTAQRAALEALARFGYAAAK